MYHPDDYSNLQLLLGEVNVPAEIEPEYDIRRGMLARAGDTGPLGRSVLVDLVRYLDITPEFAKPAPEAIDWRTIAKGTTVETYRYGDWQAGEFLGCAPEGQLAISLDGEVKLVARRPDVIRLAQPVFEPNAEEVPARMVLLNGGFEPLDDEPTVLETVPAGDIIPSILPVAEAATDYPEEDDSDGFEDAPEINWAAQETGTKVWVNTDSDIKDGRLVAMDLNHPIVLIEGETEPRTFDPEDVSLA